MNNLLKNIKHNFTEYYAHTLLPHDPSILTTESAYIQGYLDALDSIVAISIQQKAEIDGINVIPQAYVEDLIFQLRQELLNTKYLINTGHQ